MDSSGMNLDDKQRIGSAMGGGALLLLAVSRRGFLGSLLAIAGTALLYRGISGYCPLCDSLDKEDA